MKTRLSRYYSSAFINYSPTYTLRMKSNTLSQAHLYTLFLGTAFLLTSLIPLSAQAASSKPSCTLTVTVGSEEVRILKDGDVIVPEGGSLAIKWTAKNAKSAELDGDDIDTSDSETFSPKKTTTYEFTFKNGSKKAECEVTTHIAEGSIDKVSSGTRPTISGEASGTKKVDVAVYKKGTKKAVFKKEGVSVKRGKWEAKVSKELAKGEYEVRLTGDDKYELNKLATATLTVGTTNTLAGSGSSNGSLTVTTLPLLSGGTTRANATVPIVYLQLRNTGTEAAHVTGFTVKQNGTAPTSSIVGLSTVDDKGGSRGSVTNPVFKSGSAFAPTDAIIEPGAVKLFTIKAQLGASVSVGTNLMLDVTGVESDGSEKGAFPLQGTTWTIGY